MVFFYGAPKKTLRILRAKTSPQSITGPHGGLREPPQGSVLPSMKLIRSQSQSSSSLWMFLPSGFSANFRWMGFFQNVKKQFCVGFWWGNGYSVVHFLLGGVGFLGFFCEEMWLSGSFCFNLWIVGILLVFLKSWAWFSNSSFQTVKPNGLNLSFHTPVAIDLSLEPARWIWANSVHLKNIISSNWKSSPHMGEAFGFLLDVIGKKRKPQRLKVDMDVSENSEFSTQIIH